MRVLMISKACLVGIYQRKLEEIAAHQDMELTVIVPPSWKDERGELRLERAYTDGYRLLVDPIAFNGNYHLYFFPRLAARIAEMRPDIVHIDEEPYNLATWHALRLSKRAGAKALFFTWQNLLRRYPPPFSWGESWTLRNVDHALAGTEGAARVWRAKGYRGPLDVIPQFGVDPELFSPGRREPGRGFVIGYVGRLVRGKGVDVLLNAASKLEGSWQLDVLGSGPERDALTQLASKLRIADRVIFTDRLPSTRMPGFYRRLNALVLPSRTMPNWKEQFGRVLIEAMACEVPVIGSDSGAIPEVIGDAGLIFPEEDADVLASHLRQLMRDSDLRSELGAKGRERVLERFTQKSVADRTVEVYRGML